MIVLNSLYMSEILCDLELVVWRAGISDHARGCGLHAGPATKICRVILANCEQTREGLCSVV